MAAPSNNDVSSACTQQPDVDDNDMLSRLPTDVLISILEKLSLRDAIRTGALSRRWRSLPSQLPRLDLHFEDFLSSDDEYTADKDDGEELLDPPPDIAGDALSVAADRMLDAATALLASRASAGGHQQQLPAALATSFLLRHNYMSLGRLLDGAVAGGEVRAVDLTVSTTCMFGIEDDSESTFRAMVRYGRRFRALFDGCPAAFGGLTQLTMEKMTIREADLDNILTTCTMLELLSLDTCDAGRCTTQWRVRHARLVDLSIAFCLFGAIHLMWLPRLERFAYRYCPFHTDQPLSFCHVPRLTVLTISNNHDVITTIKLSKILANTSVKDLRLNFGGQDIWVRPEAPKRLTDVFRNLGYLKVHNVHEECGLSWTMFLLQAAPLLKELYIKLWYRECYMQRRAEDPIVKKKNVPWDATTDFKHHSLTRITIKGFYNTQDILVTHVCRLVRAAVNLEELHMRENRGLKEDWLMKRITAGGGSNTFRIHIG